MRRLYILIDGDPNLYLLTVPPTSIKDVNNQLAKIAPYADKVVTLSLEKATNAGGTPYSKVVVKKTCVLPPAAAAIVSELRRQIKAQYQNMALTMDDYTAAPERGKAVDVNPDDAEWEAMNGAELSRTLRPTATMKPRPPAAGRNPSPLLELETRRVPPPCGTRPMPHRGRHYEKTKEMAVVNLWRQGTT